MQRPSFALVTGAASGMGRHYCLQLAKAGYGIIAVDINGNGLDALGAELAGTECIKICMDITVPDAAQRIGVIADQAGAPVDILVNNAGMIFTSAICDTAPEKLDTMMRLHCVTPLLLCREFVPKMKARGKGYVLNISSITAWMDWPLIGMYGNTKHFVKNYSRSLRIECAGSGVSVTTAIFGAVDTPLFSFSDKATRLMLATGVMVSPQKAVSLAIKAMFNRRKRVISGLGSRCAIVLSQIIPDFILVRLVRRFGPMIHRV